MVLSQVHMGVNKQQRADTEKKLAGVVSLAPSYLHPRRVLLMEELFENLDVSGDGVLEAEELQPAFSSLSDEVSQSLSQVIKLRTKKRRRRRWRKDSKKRVGAKSSP